jgi:glutathione S-transferase
MKLYYAPGTCATAIHIVLEIIGQPYELIKVETGSEEFKKINPIGAVPTFIDGDSGVMTQNDAILKYLTRKYPKAGLGVTTDPLAEYRLDEWLAFLTGDFHPAFWPIFSPQKFTDDNSKAGIARLHQLALANLQRFYDRLEMHLQDKEYIAAGKLTIADPYAFVMLRWTKFTPLSLSDFPNIQRFYQQIANLKATQKALGMEGLR